MTKEQLREKIYDWFEGSYDLCGCRINVEKAEKDIEEYLSLYTSQVEASIRAMKGKYKGDGLTGRREDLYDETIDEVLKVLNTHTDE